MIVIGLVLMMWGFSLTGATWQGAASAWMIAAFLDCMLFAWLIYRVTGGKVEGEK